MEILVLGLGVLALAMPVFYPRIGLAAGALGVTVGRLLLHTHTNSSGFSHWLDGIDRAAAMYVASYGALWIAIAALALWTERHLSSTIGIARSASSAPPPSLVSSCPDS